MFLFFQAGLKFKEDKIEAGALRLGATSRLMSLWVSVIFVGMLTAVGLLRAPLLVVLVLPTTGILIPILRQSGDPSAVAGWCAVVCDTILTCRNAGWEQELAP